MSQAKPAFDPLDPHGFHTGDTHGHVIVSLRTLLGVLVALLVLTVLTVFASRFEVFIAEAFQVEVPQSVNVLIAMSIAVIKGLLVVLFFMQLRYDSPLNAMIFAFCLLTMGIFLSFTALDLFTREAVDRIKEGEIVAGGLGNFTREEMVFDEIHGHWVKQKITVSNTPVYLHAKTRTRPDDGAHGAHHEDEHVLASDANTSIPMKGLLLFAPQSHGPGDHSEPAQSPAPGIEHAPEQTPAEPAPAGGGH